MAEVCQFVGAVTIFIFFVVGVTAALSKVLD